MATRQTKFTAYTGLYTAIVIAALVVVNILADRHNKSFDTTANKRYSLSDQTEKVIKGLKGNLRAVYFHRTSRFEEARGLLDRYSNLSTNFKVEYVDPDKDPAKAKAMGARSYGTLILDNGTRREEAKAVTEQEITGAIVRMNQAGEQVVCTLDGHGERSFEGADPSSFSGAKAALERNNYKTQTVKILEKAEIPAACTILLSAGPRREYNDEAITAIKAFVQKGGDAMFLLVPALKGAREETDENAKLTALLASWNIQVNNNLLFDTSGTGVLAIDDFSQHPIVRDMRGLPALIPLARSLEAKNGAEKLFSSAPDAFSTKTLDLIKLQAAAPPKDANGPFVIGAATTVGGGGDIKKQGRVVVVGSVDWASAAMLNRYGNRDLFLNMINWMSADEDFISIRPKEPEDRRLTVRPAQFWVLYVTSFLPTLAVLGAGIFVWLKRR
ncbi:MAG: GldG family protein [Acidobacteria bacterium]|nr:GldG family protein [Acidobacteriota bacterium]